MARESHFMMISSTKEAPKPTLTARRQTDTCYAPFSSYCHSRIDNHCICAAQWPEQQTSALPTWTACMWDASAALLNAHTDPWQLIHQWQVTEHQDDKGWDLTSKQGQHKMKLNISKHIKFIKEKQRAVRYEVWSEKWPELHSLWLLSFSPSLLFCFHRGH